MKKEIMIDWDYDLNGNTEPSVISDHSNKKYYWMCPNGHPSYYMSVTKRAYGQGCPVCSNHKIISGINDFATCCPDLMKEWEWAENEAENIDPTSLSSGSGIKAWWKCRKCGNKWRASIVNRAKKNSGCPYCANLKVKKGFNDLQTVRPELAAEWDYEKNGEILPDSVVAYYSKKVWWKCNKCENSWQASPNARAKSGCPYCANKKIRIYAQKGSNDLQTLCPELAVEWDYENNGDISPAQFVRGSEKKVWWKCKNGHSWRAQINSRVRGTGCPYCSNKKVLQGYNDLFTTNPELKKEWDFERNKDILPTSITAGNNRKVYWICEDCGYSWEAAINSRANGRGCPECGKKKNQLLRLKTMAEKNPLFDKCPDLLKEWDYAKNADIDISLLPVSSNRVAWWKCEKGHSFRTRINSRTKNNVGCPYCHGQKVLSGENDLLTLNPGLAAEWDYEKNSPLTPSDVFSHASRFVWWKCPICGNSWRAKINNRANGRGCPECNPTGTSFVEQTLFFYLRIAFHDAQNRYDLDGIELDIFIPSRSIAIEYDGAFYHASKASANRDNKKDLFCKDRGVHLIRLREKPLAPTENAECIACDCSTWPLLEDSCKMILNLLLPDNKIDISIKRDYQKIIRAQRNLLKANAFIIQYPELREEWDYEKNEALLPDYFSRGSSVKVWWKCKKGHSWQASIANRCRGTGCPDCFAEKRAKGLHRK